ncbi:unnamed protein product [Prunus armeniaca]|uniref:Uncharacterized protein n=1 Tax=Prunus armeniaca TaxID=36596 RepID=A0A6J5UZI1_PRUAR|nr:unnamed protein product [Prunus armeniaca]CAB4311468.1 unnamed protein product [Prunus armeniaca]
MSRASHVFCTSLLGDKKGSQHRKQNPQRIKGTGLKSEAHVGSELGPQGQGDPNPRALHAMQGK